jgi:hypothetical protein
MSNNPSYPAPPVCVQVTCSALPMQSAVSLARLSAVLVTNLLPALNTTDPTRLAANLSPFISTSSIPSTFQQPLVPVSTSPSQFQTGLGTGSLAPMIQAASLKPSALAGSLGMISSTQTLPDSSTLKLTVAAPGALVGGTIQYESQLDFSQRAVMTDSTGKAVLGATTLPLVRQHPQGDSHLLLEGKCSAGLSQQSQPIQQLHAAVTHPS